MIHAIRTHMREVGFPSYISEDIMTTILIIVVLFLLLGGGGYYGFRRRG
jgi:LPXTG-motif cell wall-anchored protein